MNSVDIWRILTGNLDCFYTFVLTCGAKDCVFGYILVFLIAYILDMYYYVCFSDRSKTERFDSPVLSCRSWHTTVRLPARPADVTDMWLVRHLTVMLYGVLRCSTSCYLTVRILFCRRCRSDAECIKDTSCQIIHLTVEFIQIARIGNEAIL